VCIGLFERLAQRALIRGFAVLHETGGHRPQAVARLNPALAQQDFVFPLRNAANDHSRILVVNGLARAAYMARQRVALRDAQLDRRAALIAEFHEQEWM
jgi:hypothetical protein